MAVNRLSLRTRVVYYRYKSLATCAIAIITPHLLYRQNHTRWDIHVYIVLNTMYGNQTHKNGSYVMLWDYNL